MWPIPDFCADYLLELSKEYMKSLVDSVVRVSNRHLAHSCHSLLPKHSIYVLFVWQFAQLLDQRRNSTLEQRMDGFSEIESLLQPPIALTFYTVSTDLEWMDVVDHETGQATPR